MTTVNLCKEQSCSQKIRGDHFLCREPWQESQEGAINVCPQCGVYKDSKYPLCIECNRKVNAKVPAKRKESLTPAGGRQKERRYDSARADTFAERTALLEDDQKAKDKRQLFHDRRRRCVYCGNAYRYDELEIEHIIPKTLGGPDSIRNCQLACHSYNQAKGAMADIEFRQKTPSYCHRKRERPPTHPSSRNCSKGEFATAHSGSGTKAGSMFGLLPSSHCRIRLR